MSFRLPKNLSTQLQVRTGQSILEAEILSEHAASLGHSGRLVEKAMSAWHERDTTNNVECDRLLQSAADAVYNYFIQREAAGINNHDHPKEFYGITDRILARMGAKR